MGIDEENGSIKVLNQARSKAPNPAPKKIASTDTEVVDIPIIGIMKDYGLGR